MDSNPHVRKELISIGVKHELRKNKKNIIALHRLVVFTVSRFLELLKTAIRNWRIL